MKIPWFGKRCIICLEDQSLSEEHVIPYSLGGDLTCNFVCKRCNEVFGSTFEARAKADPSIRIAAANLHEELSASIYQRIEDGQRWTTEHGHIQGRATYRAG